LRTAASPEAPPAQGERQRYRLNSSVLERLLDLAAREGGVALPIPMPDGELKAFVVEESPILDPALAASFPEIRTYAGRDAAGAGQIVRFSWTPLGFSAIVLSPERVVFVEPEQLGDTTLHVSYRYEPATGIPFQCLLSAPEARPVFARSSPGAPPSERTVWRSAATGEHTRSSGGTVPAAMAASLTLVTPSTPSTTGDLA
jgi:hypothetical protein